MHYVCSDIHGQFQLYRKMLTELPLRDEDTLFILGDMIDRGPDGICILQDMMKHKNIIPFIGNHEWKMLEYLNNGPYAHLWFLSNNGGQITYETFKKLSKQEQNDIITYLENAYLQLKITINNENYMLSHTFMIKSDPLHTIKLKDAPPEEVMDCVWKSPYRSREYAWPSEYDDGNIHIIGHVPVMAIRENLYDLLPYPNLKLGEKLLDIDGGCAALPLGREGGLFVMSLEKDTQGNRKSLYVKGKPIR